MTLFRPAQTVRHPLLPLAFLAAYVVSAVFAYVLTRGSGGLAVLWINNGILAAALLLLPRIPAIQVAILCTITDGLAAAISGSPPGQAMLIAGCDLLESVAVAVMLRRVGGAALDPTSLQRFPHVVLLAFLPVTLLVSTVGTTLSAILFGHTFTDLWFVWAGGDFLGMMFGLPCAVLLARFRQFDKHSPAGAVERVVWIAISAGSAAAIFFFGHAPLLYLFFPVGLMVVLRLSPPVSQVAILAFAMVAAGATVFGFGPLADNAPDMNQRILGLQLYLASLQGCALVLTGVLTQRSRAQHALRRALATARQTRAAAFEAAGAKGRFLAVMSHEMRTPLNGIAGYAQLLAARQDLPVDAREQLRTIESSSEVLLGLISDVLDYSRNETAGLQLVERPFSLSGALTRSLDIVRPMLANRQIQLVLDSDIPDGLMHQGDERRLTQVLMNLLGNAAKFTEEGMITVTATCRPNAHGGGDALTISVHDTGIGIPADKLDLLFTPFSQVDVSDRRSFAGAGLGLAISQSLIHRMGGTIGVESVDGEGSRFWIALTLPRCIASEMAVQAALEDIDPRTGRVLVVDDHPVNRQVATLMLQAAGFEVATAVNGVEAVDAVRAGGFDLVFMDLHMPVMDGLTACRAIRALEGAAGGLPVIAMTAAAMPEDIDRCHAAGMTGHIAKPIRQEELLQATLQQLAARDIVDAA